MLVAYEVGGAVAGKMLHLPACLRMAVPWRRGAAMRAYECRLGQDGLRQRMAPPHKSPTLGFSFQRSGKTLVSGARPLAALDLSFHSGKRRYVNPVRPGASR
jgi:hypothetical protein